MVNKVVEVSENLAIKVNIEKTEMQHTGRAHKNFTTVIKKSPLLALHKNPLELQITANQLSVNVFPYVCSSVTVFCLMLCGKTFSLET